MAAVFLLYHSFTFLLNSSLIISITLESSPSDTVDVCESWNNITSIRHWEEKKKLAPATVTASGWRRTMQSLPEFYELHLIILSIICVLSLLADRYIKTKQNTRDATSVDERLGSGNSSSLAILTNKYLVVYGIVMGSLLCYYRSNCGWLIRFRRR